VRSLICFISNEYDKFKCFKKSVVGSVGHPNISVLSGILSVVGIPSVAIPIPEEIQLLMYDSIHKFVNTPNIYLTN
jgi:hypothetical protein